MPILCCKHQRGRAVTRLGIYVSLARDQRLCHIRMPNLRCQHQIGCDRVFERRSGAGICVRRLERRLLRHRPCSVTNNATVTARFVVTVATNQLSVVKGEETVPATVDEQSERNLVWCGLLVSVPHRQLCRARSSAR